MNDLGSSGIEILIQVFFDVPDGHAELIARDGLILDILRLADRLGISFDSPTIVLEREQRRRESENRIQRRSAFYLPVNSSVAACSTNDEDTSSRFPVPGVRTRWE